MYLLATIIHSFIHSGGGALLSLSNQSSQNARSVYCLFGTYCMGMWDLLTLLVLSVEG